VGYHHVSFWFSNKKLFGKLVASRSEGFRRTKRIKVQLEAAPKDQYFLRDNLSVLDREEGV